jgi:hypothetical protein
VYEIVKTALDEHADVEQAMALAIAKVMKMPDFADHAEALVSQAVHNVVRAILSRRNEAPPPPRVKKPWDAEAAKPKVRSELLCPEIQKIAREAVRRHDEQLAGGVYMFLRSHADQDGWCSLSLSTIAREAQISRPNAIAAIKRLESLGYLEVVRRSRGDRYRLRSDVFRERTRPDVGGEG